jgi:hypothetical protein
MNNRITNKNYFLKINKILSKVFVLQVTKENEHVPIYTAFFFLLYAGRYLL